MNCSFPHELIVKILSRLPVKSLFRFKTVCKEWLSLIKNPTFITLHFDQSNTNLNHHPCLFIFTVHSKHVYSNRKRLFIYSVNNRDDLSTFVGNHDLQYDTLEIKAYFNGLLFYTTTNYADFFYFVHNLSTRQQFQLPVPPCSGLLSNPIEFGLNPHTMNYSCVHLYKSECYLFPLPADANATSSSWRKISSSPAKTCSEYGKCLCINGVMHWNSSSLKIITLFDLKSEEFGLLSYPTKFKLSHPYEFQEFQGSLCLFRTDVKDVFNLWVLKDYNNHSWDYHRFSLPRPSPFSFETHSTHKTFIVGNWDIVKVSHERDHPYFVYSYNLHTGVSKKIELVGISSYKAKHVDIATVGDYKENMITLTSG